MPKVKSISAHKIINSRGEWTVDTKIILDNGVEVEHPIPNGASKGENEAVYLPVKESIQVISSVINDALVGEDVEDQANIDSILINMDGTPNKSHLGGNSIIAVSLVVAMAAAVSQKSELYAYISRLFGNPVNTKNLKFPTPLLNIFNGGKHADNGLSFQEFMIIPNAHKKFEKQMEMGVDIYKTLEKNLLADGYSTAVGDEGGFAPKGFDTHKVLKYVANAVKENYKLGEEVFLGMDVAAGSFVDSRGHYRIDEEDLDLDETHFIDYYKALVQKYPFIYIEDPFYEKDLGGWETFYTNFSQKLMVVADDLVVTNSGFLQEAIDRKLANAVIVKPNQVGTLTETLDFVKLARRNDMSIIVSHRSGDTAEDTFIADLALGVEAEFIKSGAPVRGERVVKYNRLLDIYNEVSL